MPVGLSERAKEKVDRDPPSPRVLCFEQLERAVLDHELLVRRNHIDVIRLYLHRLRDLDHRHRSLELKNARQIAFEIRREMHHHHEGQPAVRRHVAEKLLKHRNPAR